MMSRVVKTLGDDTPSEKPSTTPVSCLVVSVCRTECRQCDLSSQSRISSLVVYELVFNTYHDVICDV